MHLHFKNVVLYIACSKYDNVRADLDKTLELDPNSALALKLRDNVHRMFNRYDETLADVNKVSELDPSSASVLELRGVVHRIPNKHDNARADLDKALELDFFNKSNRFTPPIFK